MLASLREKAQMRSEMKRSEVAMNTTEMQRIMRDCLNILPTWTVYKNWINDSKNHSTFHV